MKTQFASTRVNSSALQNRFTRWRRWVLLGLLAGSLGATKASAAILPDESVIEVTYYVNGASGNDGNSGASNAPFKTFRRGLGAASSSNKKAKVYVYNGSYSETSQFSFSDQVDKTKLIVLEGQSAGGVRISAPTVSQALIYAMPDKKNMVLRNLIFDGCQGPAFEMGQWEPVSSARYLLIENCQFINGSSTGLSVKTVRDATIRNCRFNNNADNGAFLVLRDSSVSDCDFTNNQTGGKGSSDYFGGLCFAGSNVQFARIKCNGNKGRGLRMDHAAQDITFNDCEFNNNIATGSDQGLGMQWEIAQGPVTFTNCRINNNQRGVQLETAQGFTFDGCSFLDNTDGAFFITWKNRTSLYGDPNTFANGGGGTLYRDPGQNWTYQFALDGTRRTTLKNSTVSTTKGASSVLFRKRPEDTGYYDYERWYRDEYVGSNNTFANAANTNVFEIRGNGDSSLWTDFNGWKTATGTDGDSKWVAAATPTPTPTPNASNLAINPSFENEQFMTPNPSGWSKWSPLAGGESAAFTETNGGGQTGNYHLTTWSGSPYTVYTFQSKSGLASGLYTFRAWVKNGISAVGGGQIVAKFYGGSTTSTWKDMPQTWTWTPVEIPNINVTSGQCEFGFFCNGAAGQGVYIDSVQFFKQ